MQWSKSAPVSITAITCHVPVTSPSRPCHVPVTSLSRPCHVPVTSPSRPATYLRPCHDPALTCGQVITSRSRTCHGSVTSRRCAWRGLCSVAGALRWPAVQLDKKFDQWSNLTAVPISEVKCGRRSSLAGGPRSVGPSSESLVAFAARRATIN